MLLLFQTRAQELYESRGDRPGLPSLIVCTASVDVNQHAFEDENTLKASPFFKVMPCSCFYVQ